MKIRYKRGGKVWRREVWGLPIYTGGAAFPPRTEHHGDRAARRVLAMMFAIIGSTSR